MTTKKEVELFSDKEIVEGILADKPDEHIILYFFFEKCKPLLYYIAGSVFNYRTEKDELINELYLYLQDNDWYKLRQFDYRSKLTTWLSVVAIRFFQKKRAALIENESLSTLYVEKTENVDEQIHHKLDVEILMNQLPHERYSFVIQKLILEDREPQEVADEMGITVDNLYNIKRRALQQLIQIYRKENGYGK
jgi:RNA polymerase sigma factor (sigma-70 family)